MAQKEELAKIIGKKNVFDDQEILASYSGDESFVPRVRPACVVKPKNGDEVQGIVKWANETGTPLIPVSSGYPHFRGDTVPSVGGAVIVNLDRMKKIIRVDRRNRVAMIEPGVTFTELIPELEKEGLAAHMPLLPRPTKSVIGSMIEREPITMPQHHWDIQDPLLCIEVIFGTGDLFRTGSAAGPGTIEEQWELKKVQMRPMGPSQSDFARVVQGSQGTMGIVTWASMKCRVLPELKRAFLVSSEKLENLLDFTYRLLKVRLGDDCLILNNHNLASVLADGSGEVAPLRETLPPWILFLSIEGRGILPEEKVAYQEQEIKEVAQLFGLKLMEAVSGVSAGEVAQALSKPSKEPYWKFKSKGDCHDIFFLTTLDRTPEFVEAMSIQAESKRYATVDMGVYIQPVVQGTACHCEFNLSCGPENQKERQKVKELVTDGSRVLANLGGFFSRPYGPWADMAYRRDAETTAALRKVKGIFDPNNIMNSGKLCF